MIPHKLKIPAKIVVKKDFEF